MSDSKSETTGSVRPKTADGGEGPSAKRLALARTAGWTMIDQVLSTLTNIALSFLVANTVSTSAFGAFSIAMVIFSVGIGIERALIAQPMSLRYTSHLGADLADARSRALGTALGIGLIGGTGSIVAGLLLGGRIRDALVAVGVMLPFLMMQDAARLIFFANAQSKLAAMNDALWAVFQLIGIGVLFAVGTLSPASMILAWGGAAGLCVLVALAQMRVVPRLNAMRGWVTEHRDISGYLMAEYILGTGAFQGGILVVGALAGSANGLSVVGALRAGLLILGPLNMVATAMQSFAIPQLSRRADMSQHDRRRIAWIASAAVTAITVVYCALVLLVLPINNLGETFLGDTWQNAKAVLIPLVVGNLFWAMCQGMVLVTYALGLARRAFWIMAVEAPLVFPLMIGGMYLADGSEVTSIAQGAAWGLAVFYISSFPLWLWTFHKVINAPAPTITPAAGITRPGRLRRGPERS